MPPTSDDLRDALERAIGFQYDIIGLLGRGGMGAVYHAHEKALDRPVAIKVLPPDAVGGDARERFLREARTAARLTHPNIVPLFTFGETQGLVYFVMGYVDGESLEQRLRRGPLDAETAKSILAQLAGALDYAHQQGIVHRDVKPDNVLIERGSGVAKLTDFGIAKRSAGGETLTGTGLLMGTPKYMSPEQAAGDRDLDARSDIYALGLVGYAMLTGRPPFDGGSVQEILTQQVTRDAPSLRKMFPDLESGLANSIERALKKEPAQRWASAQSMALALTDEEHEDLEGLTSRQIRPGAYAVGNGAMLLLMLNLSFYSWRKADGSFFIILPLLFPLGVFVDYAVMRWRDKRPWKEIKRVFTEPPQWWPFWWPNSWRRKEDVWNRLPPFLKWTRISTSACFAAFAVALEVIFIGMQFEKKSPELKAFVYSGLTLLPLILIGFIDTVVRLEIWRRKVGLTSRQADRVARGSTTHPRLWKQPWASKFLLATGEAAGESIEPVTPAALAAEVAAVRAQLPLAHRDRLSDADDAARSLARAIDTLDSEIAQLARSFDQAEVERLESRLVALGSERINEPNGQREMRQLYSSQLELLRRLARQSEELAAQRARYMDLLRTLWRQLTSLRADGAVEDVRIQDLTARIRHIVAALPQLKAGNSETAMRAEART